jgi:hypothetical protein
MKTLFFIFSAIFLGASFLFGTTNIQDVTNAMFSKYQTIPLRSPHERDATISVPDLYVDHVETFDSKLGHDSPRTVVINDTFVENFAVYNKNYEVPGIKATNVSGTHDIKTTLALSVQQYKLRDKGLDTFTKKWEDSVRFLEYDLSLLGKLDPFFAKFTQVSSLPHIPAFDWAYTYTVFNTSHRTAEAGLVLKFKKFLYIIRVKSFYVDERFYDELKNFPVLISQMLQGRFVLAKP